jgi:hypothetical protein
MPITLWTRSPASDSRRGLEEHVHAGATGGGQDLPSQGRDELLVRRDHMLPGTDSSKDELTCGVDASHRLDDYVDVGGRDDRASVAGEESGVQLEVTSLAGVTHRNPDHLDPGARSCRQLVGVLVEDA